MTIYEPMTLATDYALAALAFFFAARLRKKNVAPRQQSVALWSLAFAATGVAAVVGGSYHGFGPAMPESIADMLWRAALVCTGMTSMFMLCAAVRGSCTPPLSTWLLTLVKFKFLAFAFWIAFHDEYRFVLYDTVSAMVLAIAFQALEYFRAKNPSIGWLAGALLVSVVAALVQASSARFGPFNHNDVYHVIQMGALWFFYRAGRLLQDRAE
jgi:hypothetical protein